MVTMRNFVVISNKLNRESEFKQYIPNNNNDNINRYAVYATYAMGKYTLSLLAGIFSCSVCIAAIT